jgi:uncharacterized membrane protein SpoIIM required for sporulation
MDKDKAINHEIKTDSLLRETSSHYIRLIGDADRKARIMIVVNSILLTICITLLTKNIHVEPLAWISFTLLIISNLLALFFTIASVKPEIHISVGKETTNNILHYKKCSEYSLSVYRDEILYTMEDNDKKLDAVIKELHYFGNLLTRKYKLLKTAYSCFFWGVVLSVVSYLIILLLTQSHHIVGD